MCKVTHKSRVVWPLPEQCGEERGCWDQVEGKQKEYVSSYKKALGDGSWEFNLPWMNDGVSRGCEMWI